MSGGKKIQQQQKNGYNRRNFFFNLKILLKKKRHFFFGLYTNVLKNYLKTHLRSKMTYKQQQQLKTEDFTFFLKKSVNNIIFYRIENVFFSSSYFFF